jgi:hypothetical protein
MADNLANADIAFVNQDNILKLGKIYAEHSV